MDRTIKFPVSVKVPLLLVGIFAFFAMLYIGRSIIVPIVFAVIIAIVLHPVVNFLVRIKINRVVAIVISIVITFLIMAGFLLVIISQANRFSESWPILVEKFTGIMNQNIIDASNFYDINPQIIHDWISKTQSEILQLSTAAIGQTLFILGSGLVIIFLIPVYIFLILLYQPIIIEFIHRLFNKAHQSHVKEVVTKTKILIQHYLVGLIIEAIIVGILDTSVLLIIGIDYAIILGIFAALLNVIPYIGGLVAVALPMIVALVTKSSPMYALYVLGAYYIIQLIDNNYIVPKIVASKVKINALFSIIVVLAGNALWGIPGMFLSIPLLAIVKLLFDNIESLKPWGFLLGDTMPSILRINPIRLKLIKSKSK